MKMARKSILVTMLEEPSRVAKWRMFVCITTCGCIGGAGARSRSMLRGIDVAGPSSPTSFAMARRTKFTGLAYLVNMDAFNMAVLGGTNEKNGTSFRLLTILNFVGEKNKSQPHE
jgi:hypothetical protein